MHYYQLGTKSKPALIILHGWGLEAEKYRKLAQILSKDFWVTVVDFPGFGQSSEPKRVYSVTDYAKEIEQLLKELKISKTFVIGHSFGGRVAIKLAHRSQELIQAVILTGTPGVERRKWKRSIKRVIFWVGAKGLKLFSFIPPVRRLKERFYRHRDYGKLNGVMKQTFLKVIREKLVSDAKAIQQPVLLLWGAKDQMVPVHDAERMLQLIPHSYLKIFTKSGHKLPYERPHEFALEAQQFFTTKR